MHETDLIIEQGAHTFTFPAHSAAECVQTLTLLPQGSLRRTVAGDLVYTGSSRAFKFASVITCTDQIPPAFGALRRGAPVRVGCIQALTQAIPVGALEMKLERDPVHVRAYDHQGNEISVTQEGRLLRLSQASPGGIVVYRPWLLMCVIGWTLTCDEWAATTTWRLELEER